MDKNSHNCNPELWGGIECTINRVNGRYKDQLWFSRHYTRENDLDGIADLGIKTLRYPVLWEYHQPSLTKDIDWSWTEKQLEKLKFKGIKPVAGLVHHGSGPLYTDLLADNFATGLGDYAFKVAEKFPWIEYYTPVNEPLTTARFSGIYGIWYPHHTNDISFAKMLLNEVKAVVLAMKAIRKVNPQAKLVQTEDLGKTYSTPFLEFQANFENERRWLTFDLLCGKVDPGHVMWKYFSRLGINAETLQFFLDNPCPPDVMGLNHYVTSERFLDEDLSKYPPHTHGGNELISYADVEAVRVKHENPSGLKVLLKEAWDRFHLPIAITEAQLNSTREDQLKWFFEVWNACKELKVEGVDMKAVTAWSLLGAFGWNNLVASSKMEYEPGVFDIRSGSLRPTALAELLKTLASNQEYNHPVIAQKGWWHRESRFPGSRNDYTFTDSFLPGKNQPLLIVGKTGTLGRAFARICRERVLAYHLVGREDINITNIDDIERALRKYNPWAVINATGYVNVDEAESDPQTCFEVNTMASELLAVACKRLNIQFLSFSSDLVFDGEKQEPYLENDPVNPLNIYGKSKAQGEQLILDAYPEAIIIRTSSFFGPWDNYNYVSNVLESLSDNKPFFAPADVFMSPTYIPDLVNVCLDLLIDKLSGIIHLANDGEISWAQLAVTVAEKAHLGTNNIILQTSDLMNWKAPRPKYSVLKSLHGILLPGLDSAIDRYFNLYKVKSASEIYNN